MEERWILARIDAARAELEDDWRRFDFASSTDVLYHLVFDDFCDWYAEAISLGSTRAIRCGCDRPRGARGLLGLLHPVMPHVTEEIWSQLPGREARLIVSPWPEPDPRFAEDAGALERVRAAAQTFLRSGVQVALDSEDERRIFHAKVRPDRVKVDVNRDAEIDVCETRSRGPRRCSPTSASSRTRRRRSSRPSARSLSATDASSTRSWAPTSHRLFPHVIPADTVRSLMETYEVPGVAVGVLHGDEEEAAGFGITSVEHPLEVDGDTLFQIGSITKTFTGPRRCGSPSTTGSISTSRFAPTSRPRLFDEATASAVAMRHLLSHTGGWVATTSTR